MKHIIKFIAHQFGCTLRRRLPNEQLVIQPHTGMLASTIKGFFFPLGIVLQRNCRSERPERQTPASELESTNASALLLKYRQQALARSRERLEDCRKATMESLFLPQYYTTAYPEIVYDGMSPFEHYREKGWREGRNPNPFLYSGWYFRTYPDAAKSGMNPLEHYFRLGAEKGYDPGPRFSARAYYALYPEVAASGVNPLLHYFKYGADEGKTHVLISAADAVTAHCAASAADPGNFGKWLARAFLSGNRMETVDALVSSLNAAFPALAASWDDAVSKNFYGHFTNQAIDTVFNRISLAEPSPVVVHACKPLRMAGHQADPLAQSFLIQALLDVFAAGNIAMQKTMLDSCDPGWRKHPLIKLVRTLLEFAEGDITQAAESAYSLSTIAGYRFCYDYLNVKGQETGCLRNVPVKTYAMYHDPSRYFCHFPFTSFSYEQIDDYLLTYICCPGWQAYSVEPKRVKANASYAESWNSPAALEIRRSILDGDFTYCSFGTCMAFCDLFDPINAVDEKQLDIIAGLSQKINFPVSKIEDVLSRRAVVPRENVTDPFCLDIIQKNETFVKTPLGILLISLDPSCNIMCPSCRKKKFFMDKENAQNLITYYDREIFPLLADGHPIDLEVDGCGEALVSPLGRHMLRGLTPDQTPGVRITLRTNAIAFTPRHWNDILGETRHLIKHIRVSVDGGTKESYEKLRFPAKWETLCDNMDFMGELVRDGSLEALTICAIIRDDSWRDLMDLAECCVRWSAESLTCFRYLNRIADDQSAHESHDVLDIDHPDYQKAAMMIAEVKAFLANHNIRMSVRRTG